MKRAPFKRNQYFEGQLLTAKDFQDEQENQNDKRQLLNRCLHGPGVTCGLEVTLDGHTANIEPGLALDCQCRLCVLKDQQLDDILIKKSKIRYLQPCLRHILFGVAVECGAVGPTHPWRP